MWRFTMSFTGLTASTNYTVGTYATGGGEDGVLLDAFGTPVWVARGQSDSKVEKSRDREDRITISSGERTLAQVTYEGAHPVKSDSSMITTDQTREEVTETPELAEPFVETSLENVLPGGADLSKAKVVKSTADLSTEAEESDGEVDVTEPPEMQAGSVGQKLEEIGAPTPSVEKQTVTSAQPEIKSATEEVPTQRSTDEQAVAAARREYEQAQKADILPVAVKIATVAEQTEISLVDLGLVQLRRHRCRR